MWNTFGTILKALVVFSSFYAMKSKVSLLWASLIDCTNYNAIIASIMEQSIFLFQKEKITMQRIIRADQTKTNRKKHHVLQLRVWNQSPDKTVWVPESLGSPKIPALPSAQRDSCQGQLHFTFIFLPTSYTSVLVSQRSWGLHRNKDLTFTISHTCLTGLLYRTLSHIPDLQRFSWFSVASLMLLTLVPQVCISCVLTLGKHSPMRILVKSWKPSFLHLAHFHPCSLLSQKSASYKLECLMRAVLVKGIPPIFPMPNTE